MYISLFRLSSKSKKQFGEKWEQNTKNEWNVILSVKDNIEFDSFCVLFPFLAKLFLSIYQWETFLFRFNLKKIL